jgi:NADH:ubiquinone oxidoreductase subunit F (NADH-binding)
MLDNVLLTTLQSLIGGPVDQSFDMSVSAQWRTELEFRRRAAHWLAQFHVVEKGRAHNNVALPRGLPNFFFLGYCGRCRTCRTGAAHVLAVTDGPALTSRHRQ